MLAAEQRVGAGRVIVLGDNTSLTNEGLVDGYALVGNVLSYLATPVSGPQAIWRQVVVALCLAGLLVLLAWRINATKLAASCVLLAGSLAVGQMINAAGLPVLPDGTKITPHGTDGPKNRLAYIDATHLEPYSVHAWGFDALNGLALNLQRNGYLPLMLYDFTAARLERAGLFVSIGPSRRFSPAERAHIRRFVERGGILISMVGAEEAAASTALLEDFWPARSRVAGADDWRLGRNPNRLAVRVLITWRSKRTRITATRQPSGCMPPGRSKRGRTGAEVLAYGRNRLPVVQSETELPVILTRAVGQGQVVLIGDTCFAMNKNLEYIGGEPFFGAHENAHFWRWLLTRLQGQPEWMPPRPPERVQESEEEDAAESPEEES